MGGAGEHAVRPCTEPRGSTERSPPIFARCSTGSLAHGASFSLPVRQRSPPWGATDTNFGTEQSQRNSPHGVGQSGGTLGSECRRRAPSPGEFAAAVPPTFHRVARGGG